MARAILLANDLSDDATSLQQVLKRVGVANPVFEVSDGDEAIAYLSGAGMFCDREKFPIPSVLLLDLKMHKKSGFEVLEWLKGQPQLDGMLVVALSAGHELSELNRAYALGAHSFLVSPYYQEDVANLVAGFKGYWTRD